MSSDSTGSSRRAQLLDALDVAFRTSSAQSVMLSQAAADRMGMASSDIECFDLLSLHGPMTAGRLAELTGLTTGAITGVIDRLERAGYASRERDPNDRRRVIVRPRLERHADEAAVAVYGPVAAAMERLLARYTDDQLDADPGLHHPRQRRVARAHHPPALRAAPGEGRVAGDTAAGQ